MFTSNYDFGENQEELKGAEWKKKALLKGKLRNSQHFCVYYMFHWLQGLGAELVGRTAEGFMAKAIFGVQEQFE